MASFPTMLSFTGYRVRSLPVTCNVVVSVSVISYNFNLMFQASLICMHKYSAGWQEVLPLALAWGFPWR